MQTLNWRVFRLRLAWMYLIALDLILITLFEIGSHTFHCGNRPFSPGLCWHLGRGCSFGWGSIRTNCMDLCAYKKELIPYSSWKCLGWEKWPPALCQGCCRQIRTAPVRAGHTGVVLSQPRCVLAAWHSWCLVSSGQLLSALVPCFGVSPLCSPKSLCYGGCRLCRIGSYLCWTSQSSVRGFSLGHPLSSIPHCHCSFLSVSQFFTT